MYINVPIIPSSHFIYADDIMVFGELVGFFRFSKIMAYGELG